MQDPDKICVIPAARSFSFEDTLLSSFVDSGRLQHLDLLPAHVDLDDNLHAVAFGTSPLTSVASSPTSSRASSPPPGTFSAVQDVKEKVRTGNSSQRRQKAKKEAKRRAQRRALQGASQHTSSERIAYAPRPAVIKKHVVPAHSLTSRFKTKDIRSASSGYIAVRDRGRSGVYDKATLLKKGFRLIEWDGRVSKPITDADGRVIAVLVGMPNDAAWDSVAKTAYDSLTEAASRLDFASKIKNHRRGRFPALNVGISFGGGSQAPGNLTYSEHNYNQELRRLLENPAFKRIGGFSSSAFATWAPKLYEYYDKHMNALLDAHPALQKNFSNSVWAAAAFNFGPKTVTAKHRDYANIPFGWCGVTSLGSFDSTLGGHLVMWELELIVEFPSGSTILLPSAAVAHSNTPINSKETRASFTQYSAGGLFRWTDRGCQKDEHFFEGLSSAEAELVLAENALRCKFGLSLFSTLDELRGSS